MTAAEMEQDNDASASFVQNSTKDLVEEALARNADEQEGAVDWKFGQDDDQDDNDDATVAMEQVDDDDDDATVAIEQANDEDDQSAANSRGEQEEPEEDDQGLEQEPQASALFETQAPEPPAATEEEVDVNVEKPVEEKEDDFMTPEIIRATDTLFVNADLEKVSGKDIIKSLGEQFETTFSKPQRMLIRAHLVALVAGDKVPTVSADEQEAEEESEEDAVPEEAEKESEEDAISEEAEQSEEEEDTKSVKETPPKEDEILKKIESPAESPPLEDEGCPEESATQEDEEIVESPAKEASGEQPDQEDLIEATDHLFVQADRNTVTVKDIVTALEAQFGCTLKKKTRKIVRKHLTLLIEKKVQLSIEHDEPEGEEEQGDEEDGMISDPGDANDESEASEYEEQEAPRKSAARGRRPHKKDDNNDKPKLQKPKNTGKTQKAARIVQAERLHKRRMEELRVRNEELQRNQTAEDQERAEQIAAKFETNTDELRIKRIEDRIQLLQQLDQKRSLLCQEEEKKPIVVVDDVVQQEPVKQEAPESDSESESSEDEDLEIVGAPTKAFKPLAPLPTCFKALSVLDRIATAAPTQKASSKSPTKQSRSALRTMLVQRQRQVGNRWLARELGFDTEQEHLKVCNERGEKKRQLVWKMEQERLKRNQLRKELWLEGKDNDIDEKTPQDDDEADKDADDPQDEEEDEELAMAKQLEQEQAVKSTKGEDDSADKPQANEESEEGNAKVNESGDEADADLTRAADETEQDGDEEESETQPLETQTFETQPPVEESEIQPLETQPPVETNAAMEHEESEPNVSTETRTSTEVSTLSQDFSVVSDPSSDIEQEDPKPTPPTESKDSDEEEENEFVEETPVEEEEPKEKKSRNAGWQAMLQKEAEKIKKMKKRKMNLVEAEADEEEEEEIAGLEDFGFSTHKKNKNGDDEDEDADDKLDEEDLKHVVDDVSDNEGDEEAGDAARVRQQQKEDKERHKEILRRMREGYDGRRGGIAGGGAGARGMHRFDQLVAADNREDAKRLGLLNDDELDSDNDGEEKELDDTKVDEEEDENALLDKMLKDRFLHRSSADLEENFSEEEEEENDKEKDAENANNSDDEEEKTQERLAKRFAKRARMQRLEESHAESEEFSQQRLMDEDETMKLELKKMKNGLVRRRSVSSASRSSFSSVNESSQLGSSLFKRQRSIGSSGGSFFQKAGGSLSLALQTSRAKNKTSFLGVGKAGDTKAATGLTHKSVALSHVVFRTCDTKSNLSNSGTCSNLGTSTGKRKLPGSSTSSLFSKVSAKVQ